MIQPMEIAALPSVARNDGAGVARCVGRPLIVIPLVTLETFSEMLISATKSKIWV